MSARLDTTYLGMKLEHPVVASASPLGKSLEGLERAVHHLMAEN